MPACQREQVRNRYDAHAGSADRRTGSRKLRQPATTTRGFPKRLLLSSNGREAGAKSAFARERQRLSTQAGGHVPGWRQLV